MCRKIFSFLLTAVFFGAAFFQAAQVFGHTNAPAPAAYCTPAPVGLQAWYQAENNALDSRSRNNGAFTGATYTTGKVGQAFLFGPSGGDVVGIPDSPSLNFTTAMSVEAWVNPSTPNTSVSFTPIVDKGFDFTTGSTYLLNFDPATKRVNFIIGFAGNPNTVGAQSTNPLPLNTYTHVVGTYDGSTVRIYINGVLDTSVATTISSIGDNGVGVGIGRSFGLSNTFYGAIDEVSLYNRALSASEIQAIYLSNLNGKCKPTATTSPSGQIAWFAGDGSANDFSGSGNNGAFNNGSTTNGDYKVGEVGQAFSFNGLDLGNNSYVSANLNVQPSALPTVTFEGWVYPVQASAGQTQAIFSADPGGYGRQLDIPNNTSNFGIETGTSAEYIPTTADLNQWQHVAVVYTPTDIKFYKNGVLFDSGIAPTTGQGAFSQFFIATNRCPPCVAAGATQPFKGSVDELSVYNCELTQAEIQSIVNAGVAGKLKQATTATTTATVGDATITFSGAASRTVQEIPLDKNLFPALPMGTNTGLVYDIAASVSDSSPTVCFNLPTFTLTQFPNLRIYHLESGVWVNRTASSNSYPNLCTNGLTSLSPFAIGLNSPTAASAAIGGRVRTAFGRGISSARITLTDASGDTRYAMTNAFGYYQFDDVQAGETYVLSVSAKRYRFSQPTQIISVSEDLSRIDFTALP